MHDPLEIPHDAFERRRAMGENRKLSHVLIDLDFFPALGTIELSGNGILPGIPVCLGTPNTWDVNNGVVAVYDDRGRPWVILRRNLLAEDVVEKLPEEFQLRRGAYVPHSSDGGRFVNEILPRLLRGERLWGTPE